MNGSRPDGGGEAERIEALRGLYRGNNVQNPPGYDDRFMVIDPDTNIAYVSSLPDFGASQITGDLSKVSPDRLNAMTQSGLAQSVGSYVYVAWVDVQANHSHQIVFEPFRMVTRVASGTDPYSPGYSYEVEVSALGTPPQAGDYYRPVLHYDISIANQSIPLATYFTNITGPSAAQNAVNMVNARKEAGQSAETWAAIQFGVHLIPLWSAVDFAQQGDYVEAGISLFGDVGLFFGVGMLGKAAQTSRVVRYGLLVSAGGEAAIASYRTYQGVQALQNEDNLTAAARFGEAALRLIGVGVNTAAYLKAVAHTKAATQLVSITSDLASQAGAKTRSELISDLEKAGLKMKGQSPDGRFMEFVDSSDRVRAKIHPPDKKTLTHHLHLYDEAGNSLDVNLNIVPETSPAAHIPIKAP